MATGYTHEATKRNVPFNEFVWNCATAFGALIAMRDDPTGTPVPERFEPNDYHPQQLAKAKLALVEAKKMTIAEATKAAKAAHKLAVERLRERVAEASEVMGRLSKLRSSVDEWEPPSPDHDNLKKFMLEQLDETIKWDGVVSDHYYEEANAKPISGKKWRQMCISDAERDIAYHTKEWEKELERTNGRNKWVSDLVNSVPYPGRWDLFGPPRLFTMVETPCGGGVRVPTAGAV